MPQLLRNKVAMESPCVLEGIEGSTLGRRQFGLKEEINKR